MSSINKKWRQLIIFVMLVVLIIVFHKYIYDGTEYFQSNVDGKYYKVQTGKNAQKHANYLGMLYTKMEVIVEYLRKNYPNQENVKHLLSNWDEGISMKEVGKMESDAAYVINKKNMSFCLQDSGKTDNYISDTNLITYVGIHELAHVMSYGTGHDSEFIANFNFLLGVAKLLKYYDPLSGQTIPLYIQLDKINTSDEYCGVALINSIN